MGTTAQADDGVMLPLDSLPQTFVYDGNFVASISVFYQGQTYLQTFINDGTNITYISGWNSQFMPPGSDVMISETGDTMLTEDFNTMITEQS
jgi:hypothetical protein